MEVLCTKTCQIRIGKQIHLVEAGKVIQVKELPKNGCFTEIKTKEYKIDFTTAGEDELLAAQWAFSEAASAMEEAYGVKLKKASDDRKSDVVAKILDIRYRETS